MKSPHILLVAANVRKLRVNLVHVVDAAALSAIDAEIQRNVKALLDLGRYHLSFAKALAATDWRQIVSRAYYAAYNASRAVRLAHDGYYSQDSTDHKKVGDLPAALPSASTFAVQLPLLRDDRNLCDYDHSTTQAELGIDPADAVALATTLIAETEALLASMGYPT